MHERNIICGHTQLGDIAREQTIICRQFSCRSTVGLLANEKEYKFASNDYANYLFIFEEGNCVFLLDYFIMLRSR